MLDTVCEKEIKKIKGDFRSLKLYDCTTNNLIDVFEKNPYMEDKLNRVNNKLGQISQKDRVILVGDFESTECLRKHSVLAKFNLIKILNNIVSEETIQNNVIIKLKKSDFLDSDVIVISEFKYQNAILKLFDELKLNKKIIVLYDKEDQSPFFCAYNNYSPEFDYLEVTELKSKYTYNEAVLEIEKKLAEVNENSDYFVTSIFRKKVDDSSYSKFYEINKEYNNKVSIIIQGPICYKDNFTYETIKLYKKIYNQSNIILSTWKNEELNYKFEEFKKLDIDIVLSDVPEFGGYFNDIYQLKSTYEGLKLAVDKDVKYAIKTRTDFRFCSPMNFILLIKLIERYSIGDNNRNQNNRLVIFPPFFKPYYISDFFMFGELNDMLKFWSTEIPFLKEDEERSAEIKYCKRFEDYVGVKQIDSVEEYIELICDNYIVVDNSMLDYIWFKYNHIENSRVNMYDKLNYTFWLANQKMF